MSPEQQIASEHKKEYRESQEKNKRTILWQLCTLLSDEFAKVGYQAVIGGRMSEVLQTGVTDFPLNDVDVPLLPMQSNILDQRVVIAVLAQCGLQEVKVLDPQAVIISAHKSSFGSSDTPQSTVIKGLYFHPALHEPVTVEFFLGNSHGVGYQMLGVFSERKVPFELTNPKVLEYVQEGDEKLATLSFSALLAYYTMIMKSPRILEVLRASQGKLQSTLENATQISPLLEVKIRAIIWKCIFLFHYHLNHAQKTYSNAQSVLERINRWIDDDIDPFTICGRLETISLRYIESDRATRPAVDLLFTDTSGALRYLYEVQDIECDMSAQVLFSLTNVGNASGGEIAEGLNISELRISMILSELTQHPLIFFAFRKIFELDDTMSLSFHGFPHAIDIAIKGVTLAIHLGIVPADRVTEDTISLFLGLIFHDAGMLVRLSPVNHELYSMHAFASYLHEISYDEVLKKLMTQSLYVKCWINIVSIMGTKLLFRPTDVTSLAEMEEEVFCATVLTEVEKHPEISNRTVPHLEFVKVVRDIIELPLLREHAHRLSIVYGLADIVGLAADKAVWATDTLVREESVLQGNPKGILIRTPMIMDTLTRLAQKTGSRVLTEFVSTGDKAQSNRLMYEKLIQSITSEITNDELLILIASVVREKYYPDLYQQD